MSTKKWLQLIFTMVFLLVVSVAARGTSSEAAKRPYTEKDLTKEDIVNKDGKIVVKAGTEIERGVTGKDGKLTFVSDLPLGKYYVQEMTAPKGYVRSDKVFDVNASYQGDDKKVIEFEAEFENKPIKVQISKTDITGDNELEGAVLSVIDAKPTICD